ncbi:glycosyltransferase family 90 protein [Calocera viscosa TUFC12733]|uniref:Glycosyltransferase family 90 protein n=1 Tax=Calocera viscosa (strain TUFC12733) TaxID=1330018 RepID=A0A167Q2P1_CALVF|nr:glycosyltransferase family 90 protein [Calocera viscosa TUFC12733]
MSLRPSAHTGTPPPSPGAPIFPASAQLVPAAAQKPRPGKHKYKSSLGHVERASPTPVPAFLRPRLVGGSWLDWPWKKRWARPALLLAGLVFLLYKLRSPTDGMSEQKTHSQRALQPWSRAPLPTEPAWADAGTEEEQERERRQVFGQPGEGVDEDPDTDELSVPAPLPGMRGATPATPAHTRAQEELEEHFWLPNGLLAVNPYGRHPIYDLVRQAEEEWAEKLRTQSRTLEQAVGEYRRRYGRKPPRGFDKWWTYVERHKVQLRDEYDQILADLHMFYAYTPRSLRRLQALTRTTPATYTLSSSPAQGRINLATANLADGSEREIGMIRSRAQLDMLRGFGEVWKDDVSGEETSVDREIVAATGEWEATFGAGDAPMEFADWELYNERRVRARAGQTMDVFKHGDMSYFGWGGACPNSSPLRHSPPAAPPLPLPAPHPKTFIYSHRESMNPCTHPALVHTVGFLSGHFDRGPGPQEVHRLLFGMCKTEGLHGDVLTVASEMWTEDVGRDPGWVNKTDERVVWRGSNTGILADEHTPWKASHRVRLISMLTERSGVQPVLLPAGKDEPVGQAVDRKSSWLNTVLADTAFTREPLQCDKKQCEEMREMFEWRGLLTQTQQNEYKYVLDVDGNGWSARFKRLITTRAMLLKATIFPEWYMDRIQPWVHYVPIKMDFSDLYDVLTFFRGDVARGGEGNHDDMARKIGEAGRNWSLTMFRKEDMVAYQWRLFLEYGRLVSEDRENMNFDY